jgi:alanine dehydrogenase
MMSEEGLLNIATKLMPKEELWATAYRKSSLKIAVLAETNQDENRVCLTPEATGLLVENDHEIWIQTKAGEKAGYQDILYAEQGAKIISGFQELMQADIVLKVSPLNEKEISLVRKNQLIITSLQLITQRKEYFTRIIEQKATAISFEEIMDNTKAFPLIRSMSEIVGATAIQIAAHYLSHPKYGNGTLLGGVPGVSPAEVVIIGAGTVGKYAVKSALGMGASVKVFDDSIYKLRRLQNNLPENIATSTLQPKTLMRAIKNADVILGALRQKESLPPYKIPEFMVSAMKPGSVIIDVSIDQGGTFETSVPTSHKDPVYHKDGITHYCVPNIASRVAHTASNAFSNFFAPLLLEIGSIGGVSNYLKKDQGLRNGVYIFNGIVTNANIGRAFGFNYRDLDLLLAVLH